MFHFDGDWIDMVYTIFFAIGVITVGFIFLIFSVAIIFGKIDQKKQKKEIEKNLNMLDPIARKKSMDDLKSDLQSKIDSLEKLIKENKETIKDGDKEKAS
jgi:hypothetical protein